MSVPPHPVRMKSCLLTKCKRATNSPKEIPFWRHSTLFHVASRFFKCFFMKKNHAWNRCFQNVNENWLLKQLFLYRSGTVKSKNGGLGAAIFTFKRTDY